MACSGLAADQQHCGAPHAHAPMRLLSNQYPRADYAGRCHASAAHGACMSASCRGVHHPPCSLRLAAYCVQLNRRATLHRASHAGLPYLGTARQQRRAARGTEAVCAANSATAEAPAAASSWEGDIEGDVHMGPAFRATLAMLEWPRLCEQIAAFASTTIGKAAVKVGAPHHKGWQVETTPAVTTAGGVNSGNIFTALG